MLIGPALDAALLEEDVPAFVFTRGRLGRRLLRQLRCRIGGIRGRPFEIALHAAGGGQSGEQQDKTEWHSVILWNNKGSCLADLAEKYCKKGDKIYVEGSIEYRSWQDREGQTRYTTEITAREVILLSGKGDGSESFTPANKVAAAASA